MTALLFRGTMRWEEILSAPLPRLNAIHGAMLGEYCKNLGISPKGEDDEDATEDAYPEPMSREQYFEMLNRQHGGF